jgi:hypothetical protein
MSNCARSNFAKVCANQQVVEAANRSALVVAELTDSVFLKRREK